MPNYKHLIFTFFLFSFLNINSQVSEKDKKYYASFLKEKSYEKKRDFFYQFKTSDIKTDKEWLVYFENEKSKYKNSSIDLFFIEFIIIEIYIDAGKLEKANKIAYDFYYSNLNKLPKGKLCTLLMTIENNCKILNKKTELIVINKEKLKTCLPKQVNFYDIYTKLGLHEFAVKNYKEVKNFYKTKDEINLNTGTNYTNIGVLQYRGNQIDSSIFYYKKSLSILNKTYTLKKEKDIKRLLFWIGLTKGNIGLSYIKQKKYKEAIPLLLEDRKAAGIYYKNRQWNGLTDFYINIADCYNNTNQYNLAKPFIDSLKNYNFNLEYSKLKSNYYNGLKKYDSANYYSVKYSQISDSVSKTNNEEKNKSIINLLDFQEELLSQKQKIIQINNENNLKEDRIKLTSKFIYALIFILIVLIYFFIKVRKQKQIISTQNESIKDSLDEKNVLISEVHHRVKNNLQLISSILNIQSNKLSNKELKDTFQYSINRVSIIGRIHNSSFSYENLLKISLDAYTKSIVKELKTIYTSLNDVKFKINIDKNLHIDIDQTQAIGLILNELITNSYKHAFKDKINNAVSIKISVDDKTVSFNYKDNGVGFNINKIDKKSTIGINVIERLVNQLGTDAFIDANKGMNITFSFINKLKS